MVATVTVGLMPLFCVRMVVIAVFVCLMGARFRHLGASVLPNIVAHFCCAVVFGIIIDTFSTLREEAKNKLDEMGAFCFICNLDSGTLDKEAGGFENHVKCDHNVRLSHPAEMHLLTVLAAAAESCMLWACPFFFYAPELTCCVRCLVWSRATRCGITCFSLFTCGGRPPRTSPAWSFTF